jgi:cysteinyl-tRNA synthetase
LIAEAESLTGRRPYVRFWMHTGLLNISSRKMSKSEGNAVTVREAISRFGPSQLRLYFLMSHYRQDMEYDESKLEKVDEEFWRLKGEAKKVKEGISTQPKSDGSAGYMQPFLEAMNDDFDTPRALAELRKLVHEGASEVDTRRLSHLYISITKASSILGVNIFA